MTIRIHPAVEKLHAYIPGEQPKEPGFTKLNTNENPYPPAPEVAEAIRVALEENALQKYPDPVASGLRAAIARDLGVTRDEVFVGNGSDEVLRLICHAFLDAAAGDKIGMLDPTYVLYETLAAMFGAENAVFPVQHPEYVFPKAAVDADVKVFFLPNPNPPIGTYYPAEVLQQLAAARADRLVVIDEAYVDFAPGNALEVYRARPNVMVTRTFSKSYSLAGMRVGFAVARPELILQLDKIRDSYNLNRLSQAAALAGWEAKAYHRERCEQIRTDREFLAGELRARGFDVPESHGNFVFARRAGAKELYEQLKGRKVLVRYFSTPSLADGIRITIGTRAELETLLKAIDNLTV